MKLQERLPFQANEALEKELKTAKEAWQSALNQAEQ